MPRPHDSEAEGAVHGQPASATMRVHSDDPPNSNPGRDVASHLRAVIASAPAMLFAVDLEGVFTLCEGTGGEALGIVPRESVGGSALETFKDLPLTDDV